MQEVILAPAMTDEATLVASARHSLASSRGRSATFFDAGGTPLARHVRGVIAELALASLLGDDVLQHWRGTQAYSETHWTIPCDVGKALHVRATEYLGGKLILHDYDPDDGVFVLAVVGVDRVSFLGWLLGAEGKQPRFWNTRWSRPAYAVSQRHLKPMDTIPQESIR